MMTMQFYKLQLLFMFLNCKLYFHLERITLSSSKMCFAVHLYNVIESIYGEMIIYFLLVTS